MRALYNILVKPMMPFILAGGIVYYGIDKFAQVLANCKPTYPPGNLTFLETGLIRWRCYSGGVQERPAEPSGWPRRPLIRSIVRDVNCAMKKGGGGG